MNQASISDAVKQICDEKGIPVESVVETIEAALAAAYRKDFGEKNQNIKVEFDLEVGQPEIFDIKEVVEDMPEEVLEELADVEAKEEPKKNKKESKENLPADVSPKDSTKGEISEDVEDEEEVRRFNPKSQIQISDAQLIKKNYKVGDIIKTKLEIPGDFGRMAAQTAKQVIIQKLRETEREALYEEFKKQEGEILVGTVQRREGNLVLIDLGRLTALLPPEEQIKNENYTPGSHVKVYVNSVSSTTKGPEIILSRSHPEIVKKLFVLEIPEIASGTVEIKSIAREAGSRSKISVWTDQENIDPIGSCIGQRGARIQTIISELKGEKVDIIKYSEDPTEYISNALSPAKILEIKVNEEDHTATAMVAEDQLSLAIGKAGQNVRLAARLTGWKIDIVADAKKKDDDESEVEDSDEKDKKTTEVKKEKDDDDKEEKKVKKTVKKKEKGEDKEEKVEKTKVKKVTKNKEDKEEKEEKKVKKATKKKEDKEDK